MVNDIFEKSDENNDEKISREEFEKFYKNQS